MEAEELITELMLYYPNMRGVALSLLRNRDDAEDAVQDTVTNIWNHRRSFKNSANRKAYVLTTLRNVCLNRIKTRKPSEDFKEAVSLPSSADSSTSVEYSDLIGRLLELLPENQRKVMILSALQSLNGKEIAKLMDISEENVRQLLSRARKSLRKFYQQNLNGTI